MKTPDEIKKALSCSVERICLDDCPYRQTGYDDRRGGCFTHRGRDALAYINQLEQQNAEQAARLAKITRERDAAVGDLTNVYKDGCCSVCANKTEDGCALPFYECEFVWRGVQDTKGANTDDKRGLYGKYIITKADGTPVTDRCFVLKPDKDPAAVAALQAYAAATDDEQLRDDLYAWVGMPAPESPKPCDTCDNNGWDMPQCRECNGQNGHKWYRRAEHEQS